MPMAWLLVLLALSPIGMFVGHIASFRLLRAWGRRPTAHTSALAGIAACLVAILGGTLWIVWQVPARSPLEVLCAGVYAFAAYGALAILYLDVVNIAETSLHMHLLLEIAWSDRPSLQTLIERYSPERMVAGRLDRLVALGQVKVVNGRYLVDNRSTLALAKAIDLWRTVLGLPTSPAEGARR